MENPAAGQNDKIHEMQEAYTRHGQKSGRPAHPKQNFELALSQDKNNPPQTPERHMENLPAGLNGNKVTAGQNGKSCSRAKCQLHYNAAGLNASWPKIRQADTPLA
jgi:hypothetical protein